MLVKYSYFCLFLYLADVPFHNLAFEAGAKPVSKLRRLSEFRTNFWINPFAAKFHLEAHNFKTCNNLKLITYFKLVELNKTKKIKHWNTTDLTNIN